MNCQLFETRLDELLDRRLSPDGDPQLADHARQCRRCNRLLDDYRKLTSAIESLGSPVGMVDLPARVLAEVAPMAHGDNAVQSSEYVQQHRISTAASLALAVAASLLVAIGIWNWKTSQKGSPVAVLPVPTGTGPHLEYGPMAMLSADEIKTLAGAIGARQRVLIEEMSDQLRPVTSPMSAVWQALRSTLPRSEPPARSS